MAKKKKLIINKKKRPKPKETPHHSEQADGDYGIRFHGNLHEEQVRTVMDPDGVPRTDVTYVPMKNRVSFGGIGEAWDRIFGGKK